MWLPWSWLVALPMRIQNSDPPAVEPLDGLAKTGLAEAATVMAQSCRPSFVWNRIRTVWAVTTDREVSRSCRKCSSYPSVLPKGRACGGPVRFPGPGRLRPGHLVRRRGALYSIYGVYGIS